VAAVVTGDGPLFAGEAARVMAAGAVVVWSNALGDGAPFFVPVEVLAGAMTAATRGPWDVVHNQAHWGSWAALRSGRPTQGPPATAAMTMAAERATLTDTDHRTQPSRYPVRRDIADSGAGLVVVDLRAGCCHNIPFWLGPARRAVPQMRLRPRVMGMTRRRRGHWRWPSARRTGEVAAARLQA